MRAACAGKWELFDSTNPADHHQAKTICATCPIALQCRNTMRELLAEGTTLEGTWAGTPFGNGRTPPGARAIGTCPKCGSTDGVACISSAGHKLCIPHRARGGKDRRDCRECGQTFKVGQRLYYCSQPCSDEGRRKRYERHDKRRASRAGEQAKKKAEAA